MTAPAGPLERLASHLASALTPLSESLSSLERFRGLMLRLGWDVTSLPQAYADLGQDVRALAADARRLLDQPSAGLALEVLDGVEGTYRSMAALPAPDGVDGGQFTAEIGERLFELLLGDHLARELPVAMALLEIFGLAVPESHPKDGARPAFARLRLAWDELPDVLADPAGRVLTRYRWGDADFEPQAVLEEVLALCAGWGVMVGLGNPDSAVAAGYLAGEAEGSPPLTRALQVMVASAAAGEERVPVGFDLLALPGSDGEPPGLLLQPNLPGGIGNGFPLTDAWEVQVDGVTDPASPVGLVARPGGLTVRGAFEPDGGLPPGGLGVTLASSGTEPAVLLGSADASRLEVGAASVALTLTDDGQPQLAAAIDLDDVAVVVSTADLGAFLATLTGNAELRVSFGFGFTWTSGAGLSIAAEGGFEVTLYPGLALGPVTVDVIALAIRGVTSPAPAVSAEARVGVTGSLPLVTFAVDRVGIALEDLQVADGNAGPANVAMSFLPPERISLTIDGGVVSGGGHMDIDPDAGSYAGVLELDVLAVGISAVVILETDPPDVDGWSLLLALFIEVPSIQLGFGFTLTGVGGLAGINRTIDVEALQSSVRSGVLDTVLFPENPIADAPIIIDALRSIFPPADGRYVFGPMLRIGWGTPTLVEAELGLVIELPDPITVVVLGSVTAILPTEDLDLVALHLDVAGVVDTGAGTLAIDASLHDSHIIGFALGGDMALRASFGDQPSFLMSLGGYHPGFDPPAGFPPLRRLSVGISAGALLEIHFDCYIALTSNTAQFGAAFEIRAEIEGFGIDGGTEFDALITFSPFTVTTHVGFHISITAAGFDLAGVWLDATLEGPNPWYVVGTARFKILGIEDEIRVDERIGTRQAEPAVPAADLIGTVRAALADPDAWSTSGGTVTGVVLAAGEPAEGELVALPDATVAVTQRVAPLGVAIDKVGDAPPGPYEVVDVEPGDDGMASSGEIADWFAPAYFFELAAGETLSSPSFEQLKSGIEFGGGDPTAGQARTGTLDFEQILRDPELDEATVALQVFHLGADPRVELLTKLAGGQQAAGFEIAADPTLVGVAAAEFVVTDRLTGQVKARGSTWSACHQSTTGRDPATTVGPVWEGVT